MTETNQLLREYVETGSEPAFREIVTRYVDLVYSVAFRRVGGNETLARDIVQAVFTDLAQKASGLRAGSSLGGWLHRHTCFVSSTVRRAEQRRLARQQTAVEMNNEPSDAVWQQLAPMLDEAIDQLGEADRQAIVLRFYERRDFRAIGSALGTNEDAAQKRLSRALEKLRALLASKGVSLSASGLTSALAAHALMAAPLGLVPQVSLAAVAAAGAARAGFIGSLITLMSSLKLQIAAGALALGLIAGTIIYTTVPRPGDSPGSASSPPSAPAIAPAGAPVAPDGQQPSPGSQDGVPASAPITAVPPDADTLRLTLLAADSGQPVPGVRIKYRGWEKERFSRKEFISNRAGTCDVSLPRGTITHLELTSVAEGFADTRLEWLTERGETIPAAYTVRLIRPVPISGRILDPDGVPVAGAKMGWNHQDDPAAVSRPESHEFGWIEVETDSDGRWRINRIAGDMLRRLYGSPQHPEYVAPPLLMVSENRGAEQALREGTHVFRMGRALTISGLVVDPDGKPVPDATVHVGGVGESGRRESKSFADGTFTVPGCRPGRNLVTAEAPGFTAGTVQVDVSGNTGPVRVALQRGRILRLKVVDKAGQPIAGAWVWYDTMRPRRVAPGETSPPAVQVEFSPKTDAEGRAVWEGAPEGDLYFSFHKQGYMRRDDVKVPADGEEHVVTLAPGLVVSGTVLDAATGAPIPQFRIACGWPSPVLGGEIQPRFSNIERFWLSFTGGKFKHSFEEPLIGGLPSNPGYILKFEAEGYAPALSRVIKEEEEGVQLEVRLEKANDLAVTVLLPDGQPAVDVEVGFITPGGDLQLAPGGFSRVNSMGAGGLVRTDKQGVFRLPPDDAVRQVVAAGTAGFGQSTPSALRAEPALRLAPWGRIEGTFASGIKAAGRKLKLDSLDRGSAAIQLDFHAFQVDVDGEGRFKFSQVPPGRWMLLRLIEHKMAEGTSFMHSPLEEVEVQPGATTQLTLGAHSRSVATRLRMPAGLQRDDGTQIFATIHTPYIKQPPEIQKDPAALQRWSQTPEVRALINKMRSYQLQEGADGHWLADEVPPGEYILSVNVVSKPGPDGVAKPLASAELPVSISPGDGAESVDAGEIELKPAL